MDMSRTGYMVAEIRCAEREGHVHVFSPELPGFHLAVRAEDHYDESDLCAAIEWYFMATRKMRIRAERAASPLQVMGKQRSSEPCDTRHVVMTPEFAVA